MATKSTGGSVAIRRGSYAFAPAHLAHVQVGDLADGVAVKGGRQARRAHLQMDDAQRIRLDRGGVAERAQRPGPRRQPGQSSCRLKPPPPLWGFSATQTTVTPKGRLVWPHQPGLPVAEGLEGGVDAGGDLDQVGLLFAVPPASGQGVGEQAVGGDGRAGGCSRCRRPWGRRSRRAGRRLSGAGPCSGGSGAGPRRARSTGTGRRAR